MKSDDKTDESCILYEWAVITETAALGAAILTSLGCGEIKNMDEIDRIWKQEKIFSRNGRSRTCSYIGVMAESGETNGAG